jgi:RING finger protein 113A
VPTSEHFVSLIDISSFNFDRLELEMTTSLTKLQLPTPNTTMASPEPPLPAFKKRAPKASAMRKRPAPPPSNKDSSSSGSEATTDDEETGARIKRRKREGVVTKSSTQTNNPTRDFSKSTKYNASRDPAITANDNATKASTWYTDAALKDSCNPSSKLPSAPEDASAVQQDGTYKGSAAYSSHIQKNPDKNNKHVGPVKAPTNVRAITVTDFAPDVCKDYKQTGFCGFGDSCKFLHAREDYKQGWQLDKEWEKAGKKNGPVKDSKDGDDLDDEEKMLATIPFKCIICKGDYKMPVITKCGHYFCEKCAMQRYMKGKKEKGCAQCGADTYGSFGVARKLKGLLEKKTRREKERKEKEEEEAAAAEEG